MTRKNSKKLKKVKISKKKPSVRKIKTIKQLLPKISKHITSLSEPKEQETRDPKLELFFTDVENRLLNNLDKIYTFNNFLNDLNKHLDYYSLGYQYDLDEIKKKYIDLQLERFKNNIEKEFISKKLNINFLELESFIRKKLDIFFKDNDINIKFLNLTERDLNSYINNIIENVGEIIQKRSSVKQLIEEGAFQEIYNNFLEDFQKLSDLVYNKSFDEISDKSEDVHYYYKKILDDYGTLFDGIYDENLKKIRKLTDFKKKVELFNKFENRIIEIDLSPSNAPSYAQSEIESEIGDEIMETKEIKKDVKSLFENFNDELNNLNSIFLKSFKIKDFNYNDLLIEVENFEIKYQDLLNENYNKELKNLKLYSQFNKDLKKLQKLKKDIDSINLKNEDKEIENIINTFEEEEFPLQVKEIKKDKDEIKRLEQFNKEMSLELGKITSSTFNKVNKLINEFKRDIELSEAFQQGQDYQNLKLQIEHIQRKYKDLFNGSYDGVLKELNIYNEYLLLVDKLMKLEEDFELIGKTHIEQNIAPFGNGRKEKQIYCGINKLNKHQRRGTVSECSKLKQIRYYGLHKVSKENAEEYKGIPVESKLREKRLYKNLGVSKGLIEKYKDELKDFEYNDSYNKVKKYTKEIEELKDMIKKEKQRYNKILEKTKEFK